MTKNKYNIEDIKRSILMVYDTIESYADFKGKSKQTIYERIKTQSPKFLAELKKDGIILSEPETEYKVTQEYLSPQIIKLQNKVDQLEAMQKEILERMDKRDEELTQIIENLVEDNKKLRVLFSEGGMLGPFQSKLKR